MEQDNRNKKTPISDMDKKIEQLEERKSRIVRLASEKERKQRANRLIQTGALAEKYFGIEHLSIKKREELFKIFSDFISKNTPDKYRRDND
ncbi:vacuolar-type H+-ATPase subunit H [Paenibacillus amylolyticus]|uniref:Vacuolar-type H+-ATPase subunit H n=2 Tax=Paenibacillus amylolyticus TaxID=1451 RepID=A0AAP5H592_PAEAM|nr:vacuolar-type H+-ATPase subunit H [Paenibacillus amylolyticus]